MRKTKTAAVIAVTSVATGVVLAAPALLDSLPNVYPAAQRDGGGSQADRQQAWLVVRAWRMNGPYSECMGLRGYDVLWQATIHLAPALSDDPALVTLEKKISITEGTEEPVWNTKGFRDAANDCLYANPEQRGPDNLDTVKDWAPLLAEAREHGWSPDDPFALD